MLGIEGTYYFSPRQLGATAPAYPEAFAVDYRDTGETIVEVESDESSVRTIGDATFRDQLGTLMLAGLRVEL